MVGLDLKAETVTFTRQRSRQGGQVLEGPTKTGRSRRTIDLDTATVTGLEEWAAQQATEWGEWADPYENSGLVFTREKGSPLDPDGTSARWNRHVCASGLQRITFHEARHTHATLLLKAGCRSTWSASGLVTRTWHSRSLSTAMFYRARSRMQPPRWRQ